VALRWLIQQPKVIAIPMSSDPHRQRENLEVFDFALSPTEMAEIGALAG
jgi:diketogulonate reductase-like aldo/keto reductase